MAHAREMMVTGVFRDRLRAQEAFDWLHARGYTSSEMNVLMSDATQAHLTRSAAEQGTLTTGSAAAEGMGIGGAIGTAVGATLAAVAAIGTSLAIPGLGLLIAGPLAAAFAGAGAGAVAGGILGGLIGLGIPEPNARAYEEALREGGVVLGVVPRSLEDAGAIKRFFEAHGGESVYYG